MMPARFEQIINALQVRGWLVAPRDQPEFEADRRPVTTAAEVPRDVELILHSPTVFRVGAEGFEWLDHHGERGVHMDAISFSAASELTSLSTAAQAFERHRQRVGASALSEEDFLALVSSLLGCGLVSIHDPKHVSPSDTLAGSLAHQADRRERDAMLGRVSASATTARAEALGALGTQPVPVVAVNFSAILPSALGMLIAYAKAYDGGSLEDDYYFDPQMLFDEEALERIASVPGIFLFSNYKWSHPRNMAASALVKRINPHNITIHGGPNTPAYEGDVERFLRDEPHVDVTVRGEGEATFAELLDALRCWNGQGPADLTTLAPVAGLSFRHGDGHVRTENRERIADLDILPSPMLTGLFDGFTPATPLSMAILETTRGCPYGCTFCDWGAATLSRIRKFDLDRVFAEIEWAASHGFRSIQLADANFGILDRDVAIAEKAAEARRHYGYPKTMNPSFAKNNTKHRSKIITSMSDAGIIIAGTVSLQSWDPTTLTAVKRKNIKVEKYDDLAVQFDKNGLPMQIELMMGLPGATIDSLRRDLQDAIDHNVRTHVYETILLPNSPMNEPSYREEHGITAAPGEIVQETTSYTRADWERMRDLDHMFTLCDNGGMLRLVAPYVRSETGMLEITFFEQMADVVRADPKRFPTLAFAIESVPMLMVPPVSWSLLLDDVRRYVVEQVGVSDDAALDTVLAVQLAHLPARERRFPDTLELVHDYAAWHGEMKAVRSSGHRSDWETKVPPLRSFGPARLTVEDPHEVCALTQSVGGDFARLLPWEFSSAVARRVVPVRRGPDVDGPSDASDLDPGVPVRLTSAG